VQNNKYKLLNGEDDYHNNKNRIHDNNNTVMFQKLTVNNCKLTFAKVIASLFFVRILVILTLQ